MTRPVNYRHARKRGRTSLILAITALGVGCGILAFMIVLAVTV